LIAFEQGEARYVQFALFQQFPELVHGSFMRHGGYSVSPHRGLNVSVSNDDSFDNVLRNRLLALESLGIETYPCATAWMVHGADVLALDGDDWEDWKDDWSHRSYMVEEYELIWTSRPRRKADAIITQRRGVALAMSSADCAPLLFYDPTRGVIAIAHAGWRGTARGIGAATITAMREQFGCRPEHIYAGIAPTIGACCYEVTEEVRCLFRGEREFETLPTAERYRNLVRDSAVFSVVELAGHRSLRLDLWETNRNQLLLAGLRPEHIELSGICTGCQKEHFYSYRAEDGKTGRFPSLLALRREDDALMQSVA
jgi:YfiH family protein